MNLAALLMVILVSSRGICAELQELSGGWKCRRDPSAAGIEGKWWNPPFGEQWLEPAGDRGCGAANAETLTWWRRQVSVPAEWQGRRIFLEYGPGAPSALWIDGREVGIPRLPGNWVAAMEIPGISAPGLHDLVVLERAGRTAAGKPGRGVARLLADSSAALVVDASIGWRVRGDPSNTGAKKGWYGIGVKDSEWLVLSRSSLGEYAPGTLPKGRIVWYRRWVDVPAEWDRIFVMMSGFPGGADLYVNGYIVGRDMSEAAPAGGMIIREATRAAKGKRAFLVSVRVSRGEDRMDSLSGRDGIRFYLASSPGSVFGEPRAKFEGLSAENPDLPWSTWAGGDSGWVLIGSPKAGGRAFVGARGRMVPEGSNFSLSFWAHDRAAGKTVFSENVPCFTSLEGKFLPMARITADGGRIKLHLSYWVHPEEPVPGTGLAFAEAIVQNESDRTREIDLLVAVHPFPPFGGSGDRAGAFLLERLEWLPEARAMAVNGRPSVMLSETPDTFGAVAFDGRRTIADYVADGALPESADAVDPVYGMASGAAAYRLKIPPYSSRARIVRVIIPREDVTLTAEEARLISSVSARPSAKECAEGWYADLMRPGGYFCRIPGRSVQDSIWASLSHILVMTSSADPFGLPEYKGRDPRDDIFPIAAALLRTGQFERAKEFVRNLREKYLRNGRSAESGAERIACAAVECYRFTKDRAFLKDFYGEILSACGAIRKARGRFLGPEFAGTALEGAMPPSAAPESGGPVYAYDDCYWALKCVRDAAEAARVLGLKKDEGRASSLAAEIKSSIDKSIVRRKLDASAAWVPYGPAGGGRLSDPCYSVLGNESASWPCGYFLPDQAAAAAAEEDVWARCFVPFGNGYFSGEAFYPSVGMSIVHGCVLEGRNECAWDFIKWALGNMAVPGVYAWSQKFDRTGIRASDAAHRDLRANAEWICLFRDMLLREENGALLLLPGAPYDWVKYRRYVEVKNMPTLWGNAGFRTKAAVRWLTLEITEGAFPPGGYLWRIPGKRRISRIDVDKTRLPEIPPSRMLALPVGTREVTVYW